MLSLWLSTILTYKYNVGVLVVTYKNTFAAYVETMTLDDNKKVARICNPPYDMIQKYNMIENKHIFRP